MKEQNKTLEIHCNEMEINKLPDEKLKVTVIEILIKLRIRMNKHREVFNRKIENVRKYQIPITRLRAGGEGDDGG